MNSTADDTTAETRRALETFVHSLFGGDISQATRNAVLVNEMLAAVGSKFRLTVRVG